MADFGIGNSANNFGRSAGLLANTTALRPVQAAEGTIFVDVETLLIYRYDAINEAGWQEIGGGGGGTFINGVTDLTGGVGLGGSLDQNTEILLNGLSFKLTNNGDNLLIDTVNGLFYFGGGNALDSGLGLHINNDVLTIYTQYGGQLKGISLDFDLTTYLFGDYNSNDNGTCLQIFDAEKLIETNFGDAMGLRLNATTNNYYFGDFGGVFNSTFIQVNDYDQRIIFASQEAFYNFVAVKTYANNAAALAAGLSIGDIYRTSTGGGDQLHIVH